MYNILISDDEPSIIKGLKLAFARQEEYQLQTASDRESAIALLETEDFDIVLTDLLMPDITDGTAVVRKAKSLENSPVVLVMTGFEIATNIVQAMNAGADDLIIKGFKNDELLFRMKNLLKHKRELDDLAVQNALLKDRIQNEFGDYKIIGESDQVNEIIAVIRKVAEDAISTCLITGPSGSGKELVARSIHAQSRRKNAPFVPVNCAAIPETLIESELFGHEKGAFTGAVSARMGRFEQAGEGVIFLDEIGDLPPALQIRLLRVLEEKTFTRVGGNKEIPMNAMVLSATNRDLSRLMKEDLFREDLFYRLNVIRITIPPLSERPEDIKPLTQFFLDKLNRERKNDIRITPSALEKLQAYTFPGNVRELRNIIENAFVFADKKRIKPQNLMCKAPGNTTEDAALRLFLMGYNDAMNTFEIMYFENILRKTNGKFLKAAKEAQLSREWFGKKMKQLGLKM